MRERSGITSELERFVEKALLSGRLAIFARYPDADEMEHMRADYGKQINAWPELIAALRQAQAADTPADRHVRHLANCWMDLLRAYAGSDSSTRT